MGTKLYVGNLSFNTTETDLQDLFAQAGAVQDVMLMQDKFTGKSRGFAFVTMATEQEAQNAITQFNGKTVEGRALTVNEARPREARPQGGGGGGGDWQRWRSSRRSRRRRDRRNRRQSSCDRGAHQRYCKKSDRFARQSSIAFEAETETPYQSSQESIDISQKEQAFAARVG